MGVCVCGCLSVRGCACVCMFRNATSSGRFNGGDEGTATTKRKAAKRKAATQNEQDVGRRSCHSSNERLMRHLPSRLKGSPTRKLRLRLRGSPTNKLQSRLKGSPMRKLQLMLSARLMRRRKSNPSWCFSWHLYIPVWKSSKLCQYCRGRKWCPYLRNIKLCVIERSSPTAAAAATSAATAAATAAAATATAAVTTAGKSRLSPKSKTNGGTVSPPGRSSPPPCWPTASGLARTRPFYGTNPSEKHRWGSFGLSLSLSLCLSLSLSLTHTHTVLYFTLVKCRSLSLSLSFLLSILATIVLSIHTSIHINMY